jgi:hypothetical protein
MLRHRSEPEHVALHCHDLVAGEVDGGGDQHLVRSGLTVRWMAPGHRPARAARQTSARRPRR